MDDKENIKKIFGTTLSKLRQSKSLTQEKLAELIDVDTSTLGQLESGRNFVSGETLVKLSAFFEVSPAFFFMKNPNIEYDNIDYIKEIKKILPILPEERLKDIYNIILLFQK